MIVTERFVLNPLTKRAIRNKRENFGFGLLGLTTYYRTYSRVMESGQQERWADTVLRCVEGGLSIRKWWYTSHRLPWNEDYWQTVGIRMANAMFDLRWLPAGRQIWTVGSDHLYEWGGMAANNCGAKYVKHLSKDMAWLMNALMLGTGVGATTYHANLSLKRPANIEPGTYIIPDSRQGWVESMRLLIESYELGSAPLQFDYSEVRPAGLPIRGFGGVSSGPEPLKLGHELVRGQLDAFVNGQISQTRLIADVINIIGKIVVSGNVRRSAEILLGNPDDTEFLDLKDYNQFPERLQWGWLSNNTAVFNDTQDFSKLPEIAERVVTRGEPGVLNLVNVQKYGRYAEVMPDLAESVNPCSEIPLEDGELCLLQEVFPMNCKTEAEYYDALELSMIYAASITLLPTESEETNAVVARNHRIGISLSGIADWFDNDGGSRIITLMRKGYRHIQETNIRLAKEAGIRPSVRISCVKPSGSVSLLAGSSPGVHYPTYRRYIRRIRISDKSPLVPLLEQSGIPMEPDAVSANTIVMEFPVESKARRSQRDVTIWQKGAMVTLLQQHWADNMVSNTITFSKAEEKQLEDFLAFTVPLNKSLSLLPDTDEGAYEQMPYEQLTKAEYDRRVEAIKPVDWSKFEGSDGEDSRYCESDQCIV